MTLDGRGAVVTGGGRGIGAACALELARRGAHVLVAARSAGEIEGVATSIRAAGGVAHAHVVDVSDPDSVLALAGAARSALGRVAILVNNAGVSSSSPVHRLEMSDWSRHLAVNATGTFLCSKAFLPEMIDAGWGRIVNVASVVGLRGGAYVAAYSASKHAVIGFTRSLALEVASKGVTVNAVCPGYVETDMTRGSIDRIVEKTGRSAEEALKAIVATSPLNRLIRPEEVAHSVVSLCMDDAGAVNGHALVVDGGGHT